MPVRPDVADELAQLEGLRSTYRRSRWAITELWIVTIGALIALVMTRWWPLVLPIVAFTLLAVHLMTTRDVSTLRGASSTRPFTMHGADCARCEERADEHRSVVRGSRGGIGVTKPRLLDLCSKQGGAAAGYHRAGFDVTCVDLDPQPSHYPGAEFVQADAFTYLAEHWEEFDAYHVSPTCQGYSDCQRIRGNDHPLQIGLFRLMLHATGKPYVIENVEAAHWAMREPVLLCGAEFELHTYRHRLFESNVELVAPDHHPHLALQVKMGRPLREGDWYHAVGNFSNVPYVRADMGVPWMTREGIREAIPPAYTEFLGAQLLAQLNAQEGEAA